MALLVLTSPLRILAAPDPSEVTVQLPGAASFEFAGYYMAQQQGFYRDAGLKVTLRNAVDGVDPVTEVVQGRAQFGVADGRLLLARAGGAPVTVLAVIYQHSPLVLLARADRPTQGLHDLIGRKLALGPHSEELLAYLQSEGVPLEWLLREPEKHPLQALIDGDVEAISASILGAPWTLAQAGVPYQIYTPRAGGIDFYGDSLFTTRDRVRQQSGEVAAFRKATLKGWQYALAHPEAAVQMIEQQIPGAPAVAQLREEAQRTAELVQPEAVEIGYMYEGRWEHMLQTYASQGALPRDYQLPDDFLYDDQPRPLPRWVYPALTALLALLALTLYIHRINRRLSDALGQARESAESLRLSEERHRLLADHANDVIWTMGLDGRLSYVSPSVFKQRGYTPAEVTAQSLDELLCPESRAPVRDALRRVEQALNQGLALPSFRDELEQPCKHGGSVWVEVSVSALRNSEGGFVGLLGVARDISERRATEERMRHMAQHDTLTGLPNRALFSDRLQQALAAARRDGTRMAVLFLDLDRFKPINDQYGHAVGDDLLRQAAARLSAALRASDTVARVGGDEFVALLRHVTSVEGALQVATKLTQALCSPFDSGGRTLQVSVSVGVALFPEHGQDEQSLCHTADQAMYRAKQAGDGRVELGHEDGGSLVQAA
jgi:diguanylate cyclase (GGDEF)-like protein/PAS domain S-box-containing protein